MKRILLKLISVSVLASAVFLLLGCNTLQTNLNTDEDQRPGDNKEYKKKHSDDCQNAQLDLAEAKAANDKVAADRAMRLMEKACAEYLKQKQQEKQKQA